MTAEEIVDLDRYCADRYIELVPNQNSFGHFERWLKHDAYAMLAECPDGVELPWGDFLKHGWVLCPTDPRSIELLAGLYDEMLPNFASTQINVGCDETWELGKGRSRDECERKGAERVYLEFLSKIRKLAAQRGRTVQFWGDIILRRPELIGELPDGVIALDCGYEASKDFDDSGAKFAAGGVPYYVCPGTSTYLTLAGRTYLARPNLLSAAQNGLRHGAIGFLNTNWGEGGHLEPLPVSYFGLAYGAAVCWSVAANKDIEIEKALDAHVFLDEARVMGRFAAQLGALCHDGHVEGEGSEFYTFILHRPCDPISDGKIRNVGFDALDIMEPRLDELAPMIESARLKSTDAALVADEYRLVVDLIRHALKLTRARLTANCTVAELPAQTRGAMLGEWNDIMDRHARLWMARSREGGLEDSFDRLVRLRDAYES
jgi:hypothetical protein